MENRLRKQGVALGGTVNAAYYCRPWLGNCREGEVIGVKTRDRGVLLALCRPTLSVSRRLH